MDVHTKKPDFCACPACCETFLTLILIRAYRPFSERIVKAAQRGMPTLTNDQIAECERRYSARLDGDRAAWARN
jgi:hypothetical protein